MSDTYRPGGVVPDEDVLVLDRHYRLAIQDMTAYGTAKGYARFVYLGITTLRSAHAELQADRETLRGRELMWLECATIGSEVFGRVPDEQ